jgi:IS5 family transposase
LQLFSKVLAQKRSDKNKIYRLHEPETKWYTKVKEHKKIEYGIKSALLITQRTGVVGALNFTESLHDSKTLKEALEQHKRLTEYKLKIYF